MHVDGYEHETVGSYHLCFRQGTCPKCGGCLYHTFKREDFTCINCGFVDTKISRSYIKHPVTPELKNEELVEMKTLKYQVPDAIELKKDEILHDIVEIGINAMMKKHGISTYAWYQTREVWKENGTTIPDGRGHGHTGIKSKGIAEKINVETLHTSGKQVSLGIVSTLISNKKTELNLMLESATWPENIQTLFKAQITICDYFQKEISKL
jgi:hypothetical protein